jgi:NADH dehydrogenase FAD-containing subunit
VGHSPRDLLARHGDTTVHKATVTAVDLDAREITFAEMEPLVAALTLAQLVRTLRAAVVLGHARVAH